MTELPCLNRLVMRKMPERLTMKEFRVFLARQVRPDYETARELISELRKAGVVSVSAGRIRKIPFLL